MTCLLCGKKGHMKSVCNNKQQEKVIQLVRMKNNDDSSVSDNEFSSLKIFNLNLI